VFVLSNKWLPLSFVVLFAMLGAIWIPSFSNLGGLFAYAEVAQYQGVSLSAFFQAELIILLVVWSVLISYSKDKDAICGDMYVRRHLIFIVFIVGQVFVGFFAGGFLVHQDASWYQIVRDSNEIMPAQAVILLICYPMYLFFGVGAFLYAKKRLPEFLLNREMAFMVLTFAPFAFLPYHDAGMVELKTDIMELAYLAAYWVLSIAWLVLGVGYLIINSAKEILKGLSDPYGDM